MNFPAFNEMVKMLRLHLGTFNLADSSRPCQPSMGALSTRHSLCMKYAEKLPSAAAIFFAPLRQGDEIAPRINNTYQPLIRDGLA
jgi:hypothetical protein